MSTNKVLNFKSATFPTPEAELDHKIFIQSLDYLSLNSPDDLSSEELKIKLSKGFIDSIQAQHALKSSFKNMGFDCEITFHPHESGNSCVVIIKPVTNLATVYIKILKDTNKKNK